MSDQGILSDESLRSYWANFDTSVYSAVNKMNEIDESWAIDRVPIILKACETLGEKMYDQKVLESAADDNRLLHPRDIKVALDVMSNLQTARGLRIFRWLEQYQPEFSAELVEAATQMNDDRSALVFLERVRVLNKLHLISRIFSYNRLKMLIDKLTDMKSQGAIDRYAREDRERKAQVASVAGNPSVTSKDNAEMAINEIEQILKSKATDDASGSDEQEEGR